MSIQPLFRPAKVWAYEDKVKVSYEDVDGNHDYVFCDVRYMYKDDRVKDLDDQIKMRQEFLAKLDSAINARLYKPTMTKEREQDLRRMSKLNRDDSRYGELHAGVMVLKEMFVELDAIRKHAAFLEDEHGHTEEHNKLVTKYQKLENLVTAIYLSINQPTSWEPEASKRLINYEKIVDTIRKWIEDFYRPVVRADCEKSELSAYDLLLPAVPVVNDIHDGAKEVW